VTKSIEDHKRYADARMTGTALGWRHAERVRLFRKVTRAQVFHVTPIC
jgi:hypothetical protein